MSWLAQAPGAVTLADSLNEAAAAAIGRVPPSSYNASQIGHNRSPLPALVFGAVAVNASAARELGRSLVRRFQPDGSVLYERRAEGPDYGKTHWAPDANGLTASVVSQLLEAAAFSGDRDLIEIGLGCLRALDKFQNSVPRGAQTWEIPLHTPDILASAYLVKAYSLGYELTGDSGFLDQARYWAWTGVPFVYLSPPTDGIIGTYSTIAVLGATSWQAPIWLGQPVQWCGLVYAEALNELARLDPTGPWRQLAKGIAASGIQQTWPLTDPDRKGLLPDSFLLRPQRREGPAINPATLLAPALRLFDQPAPYSFRAFRRHGLLVHAPGEIGEIEEYPAGLSFRLTPWSSRPSWVLVNGVRENPTVRINGVQVRLDQAQYQPDQGRLILRMDGPSRIEIQ